ncbi:prolactin regulatory element-binding protein [Oryzias latipes]|uniref:Prolactin regulatory element binding n=1 Tax=Oryzias latipes TaxID=8090 RepID=H2LDZ2_ORYLA|nr:prolactin regulatory element-binding protein [Oryzias latipes]XP_011483222.1 prolactin regulatory element-binding protein [Oryzias latipes]
MGKRRVPDLYRSPFPLYAVRVDPSTGLLITAGGGGASKTGIKNAVHFLDLQLEGDQQYSATLLHAHDTDTRATMNMAVGDGVLAAGQDGTCCLLTFKVCSPKQRGAAQSEGNDSQKGSVRQRDVKRRAGEEAEPGGRGSDTRAETPNIVVTHLADVQSDLNPQEPLQKVVRFSPDKSLLLTGGTDGHVRVWEFPSLKKKLDFKAHEGEIEDLDLSPGNKHLVTVGRDFACSVWSGNQMAAALNWEETTPQVAPKSHRYLACRFGRVEDQKDALRLYTVQIPHKRSRKPAACYLTKWDSKSFLPMLTSACGVEVFSCLTVSDSGTFLGLGTVTGSVAIYIAFSLQRLYYVQESHGIVVTDLVFLPNTLKGRSIKGTNEAVMLSVAVDSRCQVHAVARRRDFPVWLLLFLCGLLVVAAVLLLQHLFPGLL